MLYFRSSLGIDFPKSPYIGQIHYDFDLKRTFRYEEKDFGDCILKSTIDWFHWVDITDKDLLWFLRQDPPVISPRWLRCFFVILGAMTLILRPTILQMILQVPIEDLVEGQRGSLGALTNRLLNKLTWSVSPQSTILHYKRWPLKKKNLSEPRFNWVLINTGH